MTEALLVGLGGFFGAISRYLVSKYASQAFSAFPVGTLIVNVTGSFILGFVMYSALSSRLISPEIRLLVAVGFVGAYTTMSTFAYETIRLTDARDFLDAGVNILLNVVLCLGAVYLAKIVSAIVTSHIKGA